MVMALQEYRQSIKAGAAQRINIQKKKTNLDRHFVKLLIYKIIMLYLP
jgi:hypothetical protein